MQTDETIPNNVGSYCVRLGNWCANGCNNSQQQATTYMQQGVQTVTCNIQQCCVRLHGVLHSTVSIELWLYASPLYSKPLFFQMPMGNTNNSKWKGSLKTKKARTVKVEKYILKKYLLLVVQYFTFVCYSFKIFSCFWLVRSPQLWPKLEDASNRMVYWLGNEVDLWYICLETRLHWQTSFPGAAPSYLFTCELINMAFTAIW